MAQSKLMLVVSLNKETTKFQPHDHNLTVEGAANVVNNLRNEGVDATAILQELKHRTKHAQTCASCKAAAEGANKQDSNPGNEDSEQDEEELAEEGLGDEEDDE